MAQSSDLAAVVLQALSASTDSCIEDTWEFAISGGHDHAALVGALMSLQADAMTASEVRQASFWELTAEGKEVAAYGSPEYQVWKAVPAGDAGISKADLEAQLGAPLVKIGMGACMKVGWLKKGPQGALVKGSDDVRDTTQDKLRALEAAGGALESLSAEDAKELKRRKMVTQIMRKSFKVRAEFRNVLMQMGFEEMPTNRWVESSFWNFDALFQPQSHPARDAHDTFFVKDPAQAVSVPADYLKVVQEMHENGGSGSIGYRYKWKREEAMKNLLRTHTTAISSQMLYKLANQEGGFQPKRYFSIDRVFRNESMDATHLCEFHQVEGLVADRNLSLGDLIGTIKFFFERIGITQVRFKPAYNPYTEPSMEIFGYHPDLKRWTEIGNSGMFRPEMLRPMGLPEDVRVIAWGLSLERPTMIKYRISNIRELFGHKADLGRTKRAPICRFDI
ncbi:phenylalanine--tRNA ligase [Tribonema minus]|uniref:phenylalanine--tRNA ligase n=1 Tax=Tribonema minus TaxID=303371 RepID=A0A836CCQ2_9STRA|nr:phenylalanine--tRNA ligase [Tribonema minus]